MESLLRAHYTGLTLLFVTLVIFGYFFVGTSFVSAGGGVQCPQPALGVKVTNEVCRPGTPKNGGNDNIQTCTAIVPGEGEVFGICMSGCCRVVGYTSASSIFGGSLGGGFIEGVAQGIAVQTAMGFINNLISGGLGGGSYSGSGGTQYGYVDDVNTFLDITDDYGTGNTNDNGFNLDFGDDTSDDTTNTDSIFTLIDNKNPSKTTQTTSNTSKTNSNTGDSVTTSYESLRGSSKTTGVGNTEFGQELLDNLDDPAYTSGLSLAELERAAEEARRREALLNEQNAGTGNIGDYRSSNVSQSGAGDPLSDGYYDSLGTDAERLSWWKRLLMFIAQTVGL